MRADFGASSGSLDGTNTSHGTVSISRGERYRLIPIEVRPRTAEHGPPKDPLIVARQQRQEQMVQAQANAKTAFAECDAKYPAGTPDSVTYAVARRLQHRGRAAASILGLPTA